MGNCNFGGLTLKTILAPVALALALTSPVLSADLVLDDAYPVWAESTAHDWSGFYAGVVGSYGAAPVASRNTGTDFVSNYTATGAMLGVTLGANTQYDSFVLGVEGDLQWAGLKSSSPCAEQPAMTCTGEMNWMGTLRLRGGYALDQALIYATGGLAVAGATMSNTPPNPGATGTFSSTFVGWTVGAGVEFALSDTMSVKAEYAYADLGVRNSPLGALDVANSYDISPKVHAVKVGVNFRF